MADCEKCKEREEKLKEMKAKRKISNSKYYNGKRKIIQKEKNIKKYISELENSGFTILSPNKEDS